MTQKNLIQSAGDGTTVPAGYVGELLTSQVLRASGVSLTTNTATNVTSITLTAGVWDVSGWVAFNGNSTPSALFTGINTTSATIDLDKGRIGGAATFNLVTADYGFTIERQRIVVSTTQIVYLIGHAVFASSACSAYGKINAVRIA